MPCHSRLLMSCLFALMAAGCAIAPQVAPPGSDVFSDATFKPPSEPVSASSPFALSEPMRAYLRTPAFLAQVRRLGPEHGLIDALYQKGQLKLDYDSSVTRNAADTFAARSGNCLSLVLMTAAFAREMGMSVRYQDVMIDTVWSRNAGLYFASTHVNLSLSGRKHTALNAMQSDERMLTVDFQPPDERGTYRTRQLEEHEIVAMYMNNRAAEALVAKRLDDAYWWARASIKQHPRGANGYNTLGVVYQRHGDLALAERAFRSALQLDTDSTIVMHNLVPVLTALGKEEESTLMARRLAALEPIPPFFYFHKGVQAMEAGDYAAARALFSREVKRSPFNHEFHFWLAQAHLRLGNTRAAREELKLAVDNSTTHVSAERYSAKLAYLRSLTAVNNAY